MATNSWLVEKSVDQTFKIDMKSVQARTKRMVAFDKNYHVSGISVMDTLDKLMYSEADKKDLKALIELVFFKDVEAQVESIVDLAKLVTVRELILYIYSNCIPKERRT